MHAFVFKLILQSHSLTLSEWVDLSKKSCMKEFHCCVSIVEGLGTKLIVVYTSPGLPLWLVMKLRLLTQLRSKHLIVMIKIIKTMVSG